MSVEPDASRLPRDWEAALFNGGPMQEEFYARVDRLYAEGPPDSVFPKRSDVFRAFHLTPLAEVKVVILGQDPYPTEGHAHGLAFSYKGERPFPRSLGAIFRNLAHDPVIQFGEPFDGDLTPWANNGVLLLNTALTFKANGSGPSHMAGWQEFTDLVLQTISKSRQGVVFLAWGGPANKKMKHVDMARHEILRTSHPVARGNPRGGHFRTSRPFSEATRFPQDPEIWLLPTTS